MESSGFGVDCLLPADWPTPKSVMHQATLISLPVFVFLLISLAWIRNYFNSSHHGKRVLVRRCILTVVVVFYVSYISLIKAAINMFYCVDVHDGTTLEEIDDTHAYWALDTSIRCYAGSHRNLMLYVAVPVLFLSVTFPFSLAVGLIFARENRKLETVWVQETVGLFFRGFERNYVYWDSMILLRKAVLATIVVFAYSLGGNLQGLLAVGLLVLSLFLQMSFRPFKETYENLNRLESTSLLVSILTFLIGVTLNDSEMTSNGIEFLLVGFVLVCNVGLTVVLFYLLLRAKIGQIRFGLLAEGIDCQEESDFWVVQAYLLSHYERAVTIARNTFKKDSVPYDEESVSMDDPVDNVEESPDQNA